MAILKPSVSINNPFADQLGDTLPPVGRYIATVIAIKDQFGVQRTKFQSQELEKVDLTSFLFGFRDAQGAPHKIATKAMRISGNEKSALFDFLKHFLGRAPTYGWDYCELKGQKCMITVEHVQRRDGAGMFASIATVSPLPPAGYAAPVPAAQPAPPPAGFVHTTPPAVQSPPQPAAPAPASSPASDDQCPF
jgi:hypothetical protein